MKRLLGIALFFLMISLGNAQVITVDPPFPTADEPATVYLNTIGTALEGYTGKVYAHTGVTVNGEEWQNVIGSWGNNSTQPELVNLEAELYKMEITPSIRDFYGVGGSDKITEMSFVFRSDDGGLQTSPDIFYDVYEDALAVIITSPETSPLIVQLNDTVHVKWSANLADSSFLYLDENLIFADTGTSFEFKIPVEEYGKKWVRAEARSSQGTVSDTFYYYARTEVVEEELPEGIADGITYTGNTSAILSLYAPDKEYVFAWGDYSNWELSDAVYMKRTPDQKRYWIEITDLEPKKQYIFQYFIDGDIRVGDMYCEQVSDPWNDKYISPATYPDLPEYPHDKTVWIASVLQTDQEEYNWNITDFTPPKNEDLVIYELLVRDFVEAHDYNTLIDTLDYLENLGVNAIELMPVNEFEGNSSWGYNPNYYFAPDKYYGPRNTLKAFIDECHSRGISVFIDLVLNHAYGTCPFVMMYWNTEKNQPAANNPWFNEENNFLNPDAHWGYDFNHESLETQKLVDSINSYWMSEYMIDGFRFDFTKGFGNNIKGDDDPWGSKYDPDRIRLLERMADEIWERNPDAYVSFEHLSENSEEKELANYGIMLWGNINHNYGEGSMGWTENGKSDISWISYKKRGWADPNLVGYMESHDEERLMYKNEAWGNSSGSYDVTDTVTALQRQALTGNFFFTIPGPKMIWQFGERGYDYSIDYNGRVGEKPPRWDYLEDWNRRNLMYIWTSLIELKKDLDIFETEDFELDVHNAMKKVRLTSPEMSMVVLGNFDVADGSIIPKFYSTGTWYDFWTGDSIEVTDVNAPIDLIAGEYRLYTDKKLDTPDFVGIGEKREDGIINDLIIYPNPVTDKLNLSIHLKNRSAVNISLFDIQGRKVQELYEGELNGGLSNSAYAIKEIQPGLYFVVIRSENDIKTFKIILR